MAPDDEHPQVAQFEWLIDGFRRSVTRFGEVAYEDLPPVETYIPASKP
jgi:hypothetical protein